MSKTREYEGSIAYSVIDGVPLSHPNDPQGAGGMLAYRERQILALRNSHLRLEAQLEQLQDEQDPV